MTKDRVLLLYTCCTLILGFVNGYVRNPIDRATQYEDVFQEMDSAEQRREASDDKYENWPGRWMPSRPGDPKPPPKVLHKTGEFKDSNFEKNPVDRVGMGMHESECDDGETNLRVDWDGSPVNYTCYDKRIVPDYSISPMVYCEHIPSGYMAIHKCMTETIEYDDDIPMYGSHRPVWPVYGEYQFLPRQRWIHSLEHGAIVMLYHPCANSLEIKRLKKLVAGCLRRHIITPYSLLDEDRPLALVSWGCRLTMSYVNPSVVNQFITKRALRGAEAISADGDFMEFLIQSSKTVTDEDDTTLCPHM
ncbi:uncharacterized protein [Neodiprion pinetum]|uniref:uncharacterized protein isoform X1 n=2 Tax=Neodiprion pinetum TaxID=441929 RepID=UPI001EDD3D71|nr:uncharacterized protein LOC124211218 isoform X1 [Neodiprion pinetum]